MNHFKQFFLTVDKFKYYVDNLMNMDIEVPIENIIDTTDLGLVLVGRSGEDGTELSIPSGQLVQYVLDKNPNATMNDINCNNYITTNKPSGTIEEFGYNVMGAGYFKGNLQVSARFQHPEPIINVVKQMRNNNKKYVIEGLFEISNTMYLILYNELSRLYRYRKILDPVYFLNDMSAILLEKRKTLLMLNSYNKIELDKDPLAMVKTVNETITDLSDNDSTLQEDDGTGKPINTTFSSYNTTKNTSINKVSLMAKLKNIDLDAGVLKFAKLFDKLFSNIYDNF